MSGFDLSGYKAETPSEGGGFEAFKFTGVATVDKAMISVNEKVDSEFYPIGCNQIDIEVTVTDPQSEVLGRKLWKRFNLDSEIEDKKGKTPVMKLADQLFAVGLTFLNLEGLQAVVEQFVGMEIVVKAWPVDFKDGRDKVQMWNIKGKASELQAKPSQQVAF